MFRLIHLPGTLLLLLVAASGGRVSWCDMAEWMGAQAHFSVHGEVVWADCGSEAGHCCPGPVEMPAVPKGCEIRVDQAPVAKLLRVPDLSVIEAVLPPWGELGRRFLVLAQAKPRFAEVPAPGENPWLSSACSGRFLL